jgi:hypothetical protein
MLLLLQLVSSGASVLPLFCTTPSGCLAHCQHRHGLAPGFVQLLIRGWSAGWQGAHEKVVAPGKQWFPTSKELADAPLHPIPHHRDADRFAHGEPEATHIAPPVVCVDYKVRCPQPSPLLIAAPVVLPAGKAFVSGQTLVHTVSDSQAGTAFVPASPQNLLASACRHPGSKAMCAATLDPTWLVGAFHARVLGASGHTLPHGVRGVAGGLYW